MKFQLTNDEKDRLKSIISRFSDLSERMDRCELSLEQLEKERSRLYTEAKTLSDEIEKVREEEADLTSDLIEKYGEFSLNIKTLEIEIKE